MQVIFSPFGKVICEPMQLSSLRRCYQAWPGIALARTPALLAVSGDEVQLAANASKKVASEQWQRNFFKRTKRVAHTNTHKRARKNNKH